MESWQLIFLAAALSGLLVGWLLDSPLVGLAFIWIVMIAVEAISLKRSRSGKR